MSNKKFEKNQEKSRRKMLREEYEENNPRIPTEDELLENHSYYDIDILEKANRKTNDGIKYWEERYLVGFQTFGSKQIGVAVL